MTCARCQHTEVKKFGAYGGEKIQGSAASDAGARSLPLKKRPSSTDILI